MHLQVDGEIDRQMAEQNLIDCWMDRATAKVVAIAISTVVEQRSR